MRKMKDSGIEWVGEIPQDWTIIRTLYTLRMPLTDGPHTTPELYDDGIPFVSAEAVTCGKGKIDFSHIRGYISEDFYLECCKKYIPQMYDIYMIKSGATTGNVSIVDTDIKFTIWSPLAVFRCNEDIVRHQFLFYSLQADYYLKQVETNWNYGTQQNIGMRTLEKLYLCLPPIEEQEKIARFLDEKCEHIDTLVKDLRKQIELLEDYKKSLITETVTKGLNSHSKMKDSGIKWIGDIPEHWEVKKLKYITLQRNEKGLFKSNQDIYISLENVMSYSDTLLETSSEYEDSIQSVCHAGDIMFNKLRPYLAKVIIAPYNCFCTGEFLQFCSFNGDNRFLKYFMLSDGFIKIVNASTYGVKMPRANTDFIINLLMTYPPIEEQKAIADYLDEKCKTIDKIISEKKQQIKTISEYKKSLIFEYVTGKKEL